MTNEVLISTAQIAFMGGTVIPFIVQILKKQIDANPKHIAIGISIAFAVILVVFQNFAPEAMIQMITMCASSVWLLSDKLYKTYSKE